MPKLRIFYALIEEYEGQWALVFPDLPGVTVVGDSRADVVERGDATLAATLALHEVYPGSFQAGREARVAAWQGTRGDAGLRQGRGLHQTQKRFASLI